TLSEIGLIDGQIKVTNMAGGGGGVGFAHVVSERNEDDNLLAAASPATTLRIAQKQYGEFDASDVRWLGAVAADFAVLAVSKDSPYESLDDLIEALKADPTSVNFGGGSAVGGQDHMKVMVLAQGADIEPLSLQYTPFDGGGEALTALLGGFIDVFPGDASEVIGQVQAGEVRLLATLTPERLAAPFDETPTAKELGYDAEWVVFRGFYVPGGMSDDAYNWWAGALAQMVESDEWAEARSQGGVEAFFLAGDEFDTFINNQVDNFAQLSIDLGLIEG
ncbi:MAG: tripartite tricarboxylate transporter substrate binding protein, partial [Ardenticatenaceae bacterium]